MLTTEVFITLAFRAFGYFLFLDKSGAKIQRCVADARLEQCRCDPHLLKYDRGRLTHCWR